MSGHDQAPGGAGEGRSASASLASARFDPVSYDQWRRRVEKELRGAPFDSLVSSLPGGIPVAPLYRERPWGEVEDPRGLPGAPPYVRGARPADEAAGWLRCTRIDAPDVEAARAALEADLRGGCDAVWLELDALAWLGAGPPDPAGDRARRSGGAAGVPVGSPEALAELLGPVDLERTAVFLHAGVGSFLAATFALPALRLRGADPARARLFLGIDPIGELAVHGMLPESLDKHDAMAANLAARNAGETQRTRTLTVSALPWHDAGATPAQELGWTIATAARYLRGMAEAGLAPEAAAGQIMLRIAPGRDLFAGIAKLRALRLLWSKLLAACGVESPAPPFVHAVSSDLELTRRDPWTNLLRVTGEVFAAITGGADAITAAPYDRLLRSADEPAGSRLGRRVARNLQHVLAEEAHLGKVADPAGGSYYLETLTEGLARRGWEELRRVESGGGIAEHLRSGRLQEEASAAWRERRAGLVAGREPVLGVSVYPQPGGEDGEGPGTGDRRPRTGGADGLLAGERIPPLQRHRLAEPFEDDGVEVGP